MVTWLTDFDELGFNTQPPEGGWLFMKEFSGRRKSFNTQPPEGGWLVHQKSRRVL